MTGRDLRRDDAVPHRPTRPPARSRRSAARPGWSLWAPLLLACVVAAVAFTAAVSGGRLPGLSDAASSADAAPDTSAEAPVPPSSAAAVPESTAPASTSVVPTPASTPPPTPTPTPTTEAAPPSTSEPAPAPSSTTTPPAEEPAPPPVAAAAAAPGPEGEVLALVNTERAAAGCGAVSADEGLAAVARAHSADMRDRDYFSHVTPEGTDPFDRARAAGVDSARAENIAYGQPDAATVMAAWMASDGHRQNILNCDLGTLGVGVATGPGGPWWTQLFGA